MCNNNCNCKCDSQHDSTNTLSQETSDRARDLPEKDAEYITNHVYRTLQYINKALIHKDDYHTSWWVDHVNVLIVIIYKLLRFVHKYNDTIIELKKRLEEPQHTLKTTPVDKIERSISEGITKFEKEYKNYIALDSKQNYTRTFSNMCFVFIDDMKLMIRKLWELNATITKNNNTIKEKDETIYKLEQKIHKNESEKPIYLSTTMTEMITDITKKLDTLNQANKEQYAIITNQKKTILDMNSTIEAQEKRIKELTKKIETYKAIIDIKNSQINNKHQIIKKLKENNKDNNNNNILNSLDNIRKVLTNARNNMLCADLDLLAIEKTIKEARTKMQHILNNEQKTWMQIVKMQQDLDKENF